MSTSLVGISNKKNILNPVDLTSGDYIITGGIPRALSINSRADSVNPGDWDSDANGNG